MKRWHLLLTVAILGALVNCSGSPQVASIQPEAPLLPGGPTIRHIEPIVAEDRTIVVVQADFPLSYTSYSSDPVTLVVEFPNANGSLLPSPELPVGSPDLETIRIELYEDAFGGQTTRLAFITIPGFEHEIRSDGNDLFVELRGPQRAAESPGGLEPLASNFQAEPIPGSIEEELALEESLADDEEFAAEDDYGIEDYEELEPVAEFEEESAQEEDFQLEPVEDYTVDSSGSGMEEELAEPLSAPPAMQPRLPAARILSHVHVQEGGPNPHIRLDGDGAFHYESFVLSNPPRVVVDLKQVTNHFQQPKLSISSPLVNSVRIAQFKASPDPVARVVFDLSHSMPYEVLPVGSSLEVRFGEAAAAVPPPAPEPLDEEPAHEVLEPPVADSEGEADADAEQDFWDTGTEETVSSEDEGFWDSDFEDDGWDTGTTVQPLSTPDGSADQGEGAEEISDLPDDFTDEDAEFVPFLEEPAPKTKSAPAREVRLTSRAFESKTIAGEDQVYTGKLISISFRDADLKDVFRLFHEISGMNVVLDPGVAGKITIILDNVPWDQALDIILKNNGLDKVFENNLIRIASTQKLAQEASARKALKEAQEMEVEPVTFTRVLSYAKVKDILKVVKKLLSKRGDVIDDERTNSLIISDIPRKKEAISRLIDALDTQTPQVMIEARIIETDRNFEQNFGIIWGFTADASPARGTQTGLQFPNRATAIYDVSLPAPAATSSLGLSFGNVLDSFMLDVTLEAFELNGSVRILSAPKIATQNNEKATIEQGVQIPVVNTTATEINVEFISASLKLEVTPQITADNTIILDVRIDNSSPDFVNRVGDTPPIITERAQTKILIKNGGTAVIGGIYKVNDSVTESGVPGLRRLPLLGWLFKNKTVARNNTELLVFLTPRIL
ncbi:MAG: type IV pilus secretin PilQ [Acidobacteria bacterium]|nr:type IV pilus secretin PilQ [Acidobacteriota bacterium]